MWLDDHPLYRYLAQVASRVYAVQGQVANVLKFKGWDELGTDDFLIEFRVGDERSRNRQDDDRPRLADGRLVEDLSPAELHEAKCRAEQMAKVRLMMAFPALNITPEDLP